MLITQSRQEIGEGEGRAGRSASLAFSHCRIVLRNSHLSEICNPILKSLRPLLGVEKFRFWKFRFLGVLDFQTRVSASKGSIS